MPVTELAQFHYKAGSPSAATTKILQEAQQAQSEYSKHPAHIVRQVEDSSYGYILGGWESVAVHMGDWVASETNQRFVASLRDDIDIEWLFHLDIEPSVSSTPLKAPVVAISRYFVAPDQKLNFESTIKAGLPPLGEYFAPFSYAGGWRIDKDGEDEEYVLLSGWNKVEDHYAFARSEAFDEFSKIKGLLKGADIKHVRLERW